MAKVLVVHKSMTNQGGAEQVCLNILEILSKGHTVELVTGDSFNLDTMNRHFETNVDGIKITLLNYDRGPVKVMGLNVFNTDFFKASKYRIDLLVLWVLRKIFLLVYLLAKKIGCEVGIPDIISRQSLYHRIVKKNIKNSDADIIINTSIEIAVSERIVQYIHYPHSWEWLNKRGKMVKKINEHISSHGIKKLRNDKILTNSKWTKKKVESIYPCTAQVVYPPIPTAEFESKAPPEERVDGFIIAGRVAPKKNIIRSIQIIEEVRQSGFDIVLNIIGPDHQNEQYASRVKSLADGHEWITYEGRVSRERLVHLFTNYKYGIHGHNSEHFGIVVAEMVGAGMVPFVPNDGGQREIVGDKRLIYESKNDAVEKIKNISSNKSEYISVLEGMNDIKKMCGVNKFKKYISKIVEEEQKCKSGV